MRLRRVRALRAPSRSVADDLPIFCSNFPPFDRGTTPMRRRNTLKGMDAAAQARKNRDYSRPPINAGAAGSEGRRCFRV